VIGSPPRYQTAVVRVLVVVLWVVLTAFKSNADVLSAPNSLVFRPTADVVLDVVSSSWAPIATSLQIAAITTVVVLLVGLPAAYALATHRTRGWRRVITVVLTAFLLLQMTPQPMTVIPLYSILARWHLVDSLAGLVLADVALMTPFAVLILRPFVLAVPNALQEAAQIDGASRFRIFRSIYLPMLGNGVFTVGSIVFIITWGEFIYAINFLSDPALATVSQVLAGQTSVYSTNWNRLMSLALVTSLPILVVFLLAQRRLVRGLAVGSVK
jgi:multiple sugar transport system permease protein